MKNHIFRIIILVPIIISAICFVSGCTSSEDYYFRIDDTNNAVSEAVGFLQLPDFLRGYFEHGTYELPTRVPNPMCFGDIEVSSEEQLIFPELSVLSVYTYNTDSMFLIKQDDTRINQLFEAMKNSTVSTNNSINFSERVKNTEQDCELHVVLVTGSAKYAVVSLYCTDDLVYIQIDQEEREKLLLATQSTELLNFVREFRNI